MDRSLEALENTPRFSWARLGVAVSISGLIMMGVSLFISTCPTVGYRAGYDAVLAKGPEWVDVEVDSADGTALRACDQLLIQTGDAQFVEYSEFVKGCSDGVNYLYGRHVPLLAEAR